jgi:hypothetical protein
MPRSKNLFSPDSVVPYKVSRTGLELFHDCPRCFYFDKRLGKKRPSGPPFTLNSAVDKLLKREFDKYRAQKVTHPLMVMAGINAIPLSHPELDQWRNNFKGIQFHHEFSNLLIYGAVDDLWESESGEWIVVDYKATAKASPISELNAEWHLAYKRQLEVYQWLLRQNGHQVSNRAYWVYANGNVEAEAFNQTLQFRMTVVPHEGDDSWVEAHILKAKDCLLLDAAPLADAGCEWCRFVADRFDPI